MVRAQACTLNASLVMSSVCKGDRLLALSLESVPFRSVEYVDPFADVLLAPIFVILVLFDFGPHCGRCCMAMAAVLADKQDLG